MYNEIAYLCSERIETDEALNQVKVLDERMVFVKPKSIGMSEFYQAATAGLKPTLTLILADEGDYSGEKIVRYEGDLYDVIRTYVNGYTVELTITGRVGRV